TSPREPSQAAAPDDPASAGRSTTGGRIVRKVASAVLIVLTCVLVPVSVLTVWVHDIVLDTDRYVATVKPLASGPGDRGRRAQPHRPGRRRTGRRQARHLRTRGLAAVAGPRHPPRPGRYGGWPCNWTRP
ncbi:hypothetical protein ACRAWF_20060, partial [Streptomyces sp. L7]